MEIKEALEVLEGIGNEDTITPEIDKAIEKVVDDIRLTARERERVKNWKEKTRKLLDEVTKEVSESQSRMAEANFKLFNLLDLLQK